METQFVPAPVSREVWRVAQDRCQCIRPACHGGAGRCAVTLDSGEGRVCLVDPHGPLTVWNCILLCSRCLKTLMEPAWVD
jgi:hypothetical protein